MKTTYIAGKYLAICDVCGLRHYNTELRKDWRGLMVCSKDYETRHPQDFLRVRGDNPAVPWARPEAPNQFIPTTYICTPEGSTAITGIAVAGCSIAGNSNPVWPGNRSAVAGIAIAGSAIAGHI